MTLKNSQGFYKKVVGEGTELGFGEETLTPLPTLRSSECKSISSFHQGGLCRSGPWGRSSFRGKLQVDCGEAKSGGDVPDQKQMLSRAELEG